jgi:hypothetical protein
VNDCQTPAGLNDEQPFLCPPAVTRIIKYTHPGRYKLRLLPDLPAKHQDFREKQKTPIFDYLGKRTIYSEIIDSFRWPIVSWN